MDRPLVSIIIPCYNGEEFVADAIRSALEQTYHKREILVVDDGSTDDSLDVITSFGDRIRYVSKTNSGAAASRNVGLRQTTGSLVQFLDADDLLHPRKLEMQVPRMLQCRGSTVFSDAFVGVAGSRDERDSYEWTLTRQEPNGICRSIHHIYYVSPPLHWRANLERVGGFDEALPCLQDYDLHLRMACRGVQFIHLAESLVTIRRRAGSISADHARLLREWPGVLKKCIGFLRDRDRLTPEIQRCFATKLAALSRELVAGQDVRLGLETLRLAESLGGRESVRAAYDRKSWLVRRALGPVVSELVIGEFRRIFRGGR